MYSRFPDSKRSVLGICSGTVINSSPRPIRFHYHANRIIVSMEKISTSSEETSDGPIISFHLYDKHRRYLLSPDYS